MATFLEQYKPLRNECEARGEEPLVEIYDYAAQLEAALNVVLDQVDYTTGACRVNEMVGAVLHKELIEKARKALGKGGYHMEA